MNSPPAARPSPRAGPIAAARRIAHAIAATLQPARTTAGRAARTTTPIADAGQRVAELQGIFENAAAGIVEFDLATNRLIRANRCTCDMLGRTEADLRANAGPDQWAEAADQADPAHQWAAIRENGQSFTYEQRFGESLVSPVWARIGVAVTALDRAGKPRRLCAILHDITARKAAEADLIANQDLLRLSLEIGAVGTFRRDDLAGLIFVDPQTRFLHGLAHASDPVLAREWFETVLPEDRGRVLEDFARAAQERRDFLSYQYRFRHPERGVRYAEARSRMTYDARGRVIGSVGVIIDVTERRLWEAKLAHLAHYDPLTGLANRSLFAIRLDEALRHAKAGDACAILSVDIDRFKHVNDNFGHLLGDKLLRMVADRLRAASRDTDMIARLGGDEFAIIQAPLLRRSDAQALAQRLIGVVSGPYRVEGTSIMIGASVGTTIVPDDGIQADQVLQNVDLALYTAKSAGRGRILAFEPAMEERQRRRHALDTDMREALATNAFEMFYQPIMAMASGALHGFEALIRWRSPTRGLVAPDEFIPVAETNGMIIPIGAFVMHTACAHAASWPGNLSIAVNLSASEFANPGLAATILAALDRCRLDPSRLELEITETAMLQDSSVTLEALHRLKALGIRLSIDDFGTGFSSLSYLQRFPFDKVKIDRAFITPLGTTPASLIIARSIVSLCTDLGIETTAEGVETPRQFELLHQLGCTQAQGYLFSRPVPQGDVAALIAEDAGRHPRRM